MTPSDSQREVHRLSRIVELLLRQSAVASTEILCVAIADARPRSSDRSPSRNLHVPAKSPVAT